MSKPGDVWSHRQTIYTCLYLHKDAKPKLLQCAAPLLPLPPAPLDGGAPAPAPEAVAIAAAKLAASGAHDLALLALAMHAVCSAVVHTTQYLRDMVLQVSAACGDPRWRLPWQAPAAVAVLRAISKPLRTRCARPALRMNGHSIHSLGCG